MSLLGIKSTLRYTEKPRYLAASNPISPLIVLQNGVTQKRLAWMSLLEAPNSFSPPRDLLLQNVPLQTKSRDIWLCYKHFPVQARFHEEPCI